MESLVLTNDILCELSKQSEESANLIKKEQLLEESLSKTISLNIYHSLQNTSETFQDKLNSFKNNLQEKIQTIKSLKQEIEEQKTKEKSMKKNLAKLKEQDHESQDFEDSILYIESQELEYLSSEIQTQRLLLSLKAEEFHEKTQQSYVKAEKIRNLKEKLNAYETTILTSSPLPFSPPKTEYQANPLPIPVFSESSTFSEIPFKHTEKSLSNETLKQAEEASSLQGQKNKTIGKVLLSKNKKQKKLVEADDFFAELTGDGRKKV
ncbi:hypothetical protein SteCoe_6995 [Stentor coeruleus]|uniref:Uncharacterized protein n=1 Tax=Stentor coeruleus TaxID=5963 RepID=A0A1R2CNK0_9CILI|nr:hypothetical protein SteCoe_6995 [Stentor coeruleus]